MKNSPFLFFNLGVFEFVFASELYVVFVPLDFRQRRASLQLTRQSCSSALHHVVLNLHRLQFGLHCEREERRREREEEEREGGEKRGKREEREEKRRNSGEERKGKY